MEGLITYHRTDSTTLSDKALQESARVIREMFGAEYHDSPRRYQTRVKNAQEAHEAIRPTDFRLAPSQLEGVLDSDDLQRLRVGLEADDGVANGRRPCPADHDRDLRRRSRRRARRADGQREGDRVRRLPPRLRGGQRRPGRGTGRTGSDPARSARRAIASTTTAARRSRSSAPRPRSTKRHRPHDSRKRPSSRSWSGSASAGRRRTRRPSPRSSGAATCSVRARRWCPASRRLPSRRCCAITSGTSSRPTSPPKWKRISTRFPAANASRRRS